MRVNPFALLLAPLVACVPAAASAQDASRPATALTASAVALASVHPIDDTYVGLPYLDRGLGGVGPAAGVALTLRHRMFAVGLEWSAAHLEVEQRGRLADEGSTGRLRDSLLTLFAGLEVPAERVHFRLVAGLSRVGGNPAAGGVPIDRSYEGLPLSDTAARYAPMAGFDLIRG